MKKNHLEVDIKVPNQTRYLSLIGRIGEDIAKELDKFTGNRETLAHHINLVLTEAMANAIKYAGTENPHKMVHICITISADDILIKVFDHGQGFDINAIPPPNFERAGRPGERDIHHPVPHGFRSIQEAVGWQCPDHVKKA